MKPKQTMYIFGNPDIAFDSLPIKILPRLQEKFPEIEFIIRDPNEEWEISNRQIFIIDSVEGISNICLFDDIEKFIPAPRVSIHDFDALTNLRFLKKIGQIDSVKIIGLPMNIDQQTAFEGVSLEIEREIR